MIAAKRPPAPPPPTYEEARAKVIRILSNESGHENLGSVSLNTDTLRALLAGPPERPCPECDAVSSAIGGVEFMDPPDGGSVTLSEQVGRMRAKLDAFTPAVQKPRPYPHAVGPTKYSECFGFEGGSLTVKTLGYGDADGAGWMVFAEGDLEWEQSEDGKDYRILNLANSELIFMRNKLCEVFPAASPEPNTPTSEVREAVDELLKCVRYFRDAKTIGEQSGRGEELARKVEITVRAITGGHRP